MVIHGPAVWTAAERGIDLAARGVAQPPAKRVLLVENEPALASAYSEHLAREGFTVDLAVNGLEAMYHLEEDLPDVVVLELHLPLVSGFRVTQLLKRDPLTRSIPVLVLTRISPQEARDVLRVGVDDFLMKPVAPREIVSRVSYLLSH